MLSLGDFVLILSGACVLALTKTHCCCVHASSHTLTHPSFFLLLLLPSVSPENHPAVIDVGPVRPIRISSKTGAPMQPNRQTRQDKHADEEEDEYSEEEVVNEGVARPKGETTEEKRARKKAIKEQRRVGRSLCVYVCVCD
jgi:hypothetical protein